MSAALHLALVWMWVVQTLRTPQARHADKPAARAVLRIIAAPAATEPRVGAPTARVPRVAVPPAGRGPRRAASDDAPADALPPSPSPSPAPPSPEAPSALDLHLPAGSASAAARSMVAAALNDARANSRRTASERFAINLGTNTDRIEERIVDGMRIRQGTRCVLVHDSKIAAVDPFSQGMRPSPKVAEPCP